MTYETTTTKTMTNRELAEAIVDDRITRGQFGADDRDWLVEREMRETRESLVNGFNAIEHWNDADTDTDTDDDGIWDIEYADRREFNGDTSDLGELLGDSEWMYDIDALVDMLTIVTPDGTFWLLEEETPDWDEIDAACIWSPDGPRPVEHILDWYNMHADTEILDVDPEMVLDALTIDVDGEREWLPLSRSQVDDIIYNLALVTSDNMGTLQADDIDEDHLDEMWEVLAWADVTPLWIDPDMEEHALGEIWWAMTTDHGAYVTWKHLTRAQVAEVVDEVLA
jgi:hypothetical protein